LTAAPSEIDDRRMPPPAPQLAAGALAGNYKQLVEEYDQTMVPGILTALNKLDAGGGPAKNKALATAAIEVIKKWEPTFIAQTKKVTNLKEKAARLEFTLELQGLKRTIRGESKGTDSGGTGAPTGKQKEPWKKTKLGYEIMKARQWVPFGAAAKLLALDEAETNEQAEPLLEPALKAIEEEDKDVSEIMKAAKDKELKKKLVEYKGALATILKTLKDLSK
jgi:hypothetical protein